MFRFGDTCGLFGNSSDSEDEEVNSGSLDAVADKSLDSGPNSFELTYKCGKISILQDKVKGIAHQLWPAASFLCQYLDENAILESLNWNITTPIIELGAGVGLCGLYFWLRGSEKVIITDLEEARKLIDTNIENNRSIRNVGGDVQFFPLDWFDRTAVASVFSVIPEGSHPLVVASDCVYFEHLFEPLYLTLKELTDRGCTVLIAHVRRWKKDGKFFTMCKKTMQVKVIVEVVESVPHEHTGELQRNVVRVYQISNI